MSEDETILSSVSARSAIYPPQEFKQDPVPNTIAQIVGSAMEKAGVVTRDSDHFHTLYDRDQAKRLLKEIGDKRRNGENANGLFQELKDRGRINESYLCQGQVDVAMGELGVQSSQYVIMEPPNHLRDPKYKDCPIVCIPGISNSLAGFEALVKELVYEGRTVIAIAQPESTNGVVTEAFAQATESKANLGPHIDFFDEAVRLALKQRMDSVYASEVASQLVRFDLLGHSTGCAIIAGLLGRELFQAATHNAILISPAGVTEQTIKEFDGATVPELLTFVKNRSRLSAFNRDNSPQTPVKARVTESVKKTIIHPLDDLYTGANLANGHQILVLSGNKDQIVKSRQARKRVMGLNPKLKWVSMPSAAHAEALVNPGRVVGLINEHLED